MNMGSQGFTEAEREIEVELKYARSGLAYGALAHRPDPYRLCGFVAMSIRRRRKPGNRIQDAVNDILLYLGEPQTHSGLLASAVGSTAMGTSSIPILCTAPSETRLKNLKSMPVSQSAFTPEGRGV
jgi:hypothetical protein